MVTPVVLEEAEKFIRAVNAGRFDIVMKELAEAVRYRQVIVSHKKLATLREGQLAKFSQTVRPEYLRGRRVKILGIRRTRILVQLMDGPVGKFLGGTIIAHAMSLELE